MPVRIRFIEPQDDLPLAKIIRDAFAEFGVCGPGSSAEDPHVNGMHAAYQKEGSRYIVAEGQGRILGGGGFAPLAGGPEHTCELQKMFLEPRARGKGIGRAILDRCLDEARTLGYTHCYLETRANMHAAHAMYRRAGFDLCEAPLGATGHWTCEAWFLKEL